jgi:hypothetical protein
MSQTKNYYLLSQTLSNLKYNQPKRTQQSIRENYIPITAPLQELGHFLQHDVHQSLFFWMLLQVFQRGSPSMCELGSRGQEAIQSKEEHFSFVSGSVVL